jgi:exonuclease III
MPRINTHTPAATPPPSQRDPNTDHENGPHPGTNQYHPIPRATVPVTPNHAKKDKPMRASINIATLNMNGFTAPASCMTGIEKWSTVNRTISDHKIAILALQETHLDPALLHDIDMCFGKRLTIINSQAPDNPRASAGVAFVINKTLIAPKEISTHELVKGRALALRIKWREDEEMALINVYAPNNRAEHSPFWKKVEAERRRHNIRRPDFLLGDLNVTEDPIDRAPAHADDLNAVEALRNFRHSLDLQDSWRHAFPHDRCFTYRAHNNGLQIKSRLDRIYTSTTAAKHTFGWLTSQTAVPTDHWMVLTKYAPADAPFIGKGRWTWQLPSLEDKELIKKVVERGMHLQQNLN